MITIRGLKKSFNGFEVLRGVDLTIYPETITFIMGQSGSGKSVLLKHIVGLIKPDAGEIWFENQDITKLSERELQKVRKNIGFLFQEGALFDSMTVAENVAFPLIEHFKLSSKEVEKEVYELLDSVDLLEARNKYPSELSGGMKKRAALARTLALKPKVILFDEPTTGLDPILQMSIMGLIKTLKERYKLTCVIVSHDVPLALKFADYIAFLHQGVILKVGTPQEVKEAKEEFIRTFLESGLI